MVWLAIDAVMFAANFFAGTLAMSNDDYLVSVLNASVCAFIVYFRINRY